ncbi:uncharacterized protein VTP21DRAFT_8435 [Calcarisporiella thermophila]|uniref:uncharacterized protein n=1 Tax=Calcarisporiella thermophila TaxID=911321 RepID=UPI0037436EE5
MSEKPLDMPNLLEESRRAREKSSLEDFDSISVPASPLFASLQITHSPDGVLLFSLVALYILLSTLHVVGTRFLPRSPYTHIAFQALFSWVIAKAAAKGGWYTPRKMEQKEWWSITGVAALFAVTICLPDLLNYFYSLPANTLYSGLVPICTYGISSLIFKEKHPRFTHLILVAVSIGIVFMDAEFQFYLPLSISNFPYLLLKVTLAVVFIGLVSLKDIFINRALDGLLNLHPLEFLCHSAPLVLVSSLLCGFFIGEFPQRLYSSENTLALMLEITGNSMLGYLNILVLLVLNMVCGPLVVSVVSGLEQVVLALSTLMVLGSLGGNGMLVTGASMTLLGTVVYLKMLCNRSE